LTAYKGSDGHSPISEVHVIEGLHDILGARSTFFLSLGH